MKRILLLLLVLVMLLGGILVWRASNLESRQIAVEPAEPIQVNTDEETARLAGAIQIRSVSYEKAEEFPADEFRKLNAYLEQQFPVVHQRLIRESISEYSALYTWGGDDPNLKPVVLMAHLDTVPVVPGTDDRWQYPPFEGRIAEGFVWGRGAMDDKFAVVALMSAFEHLLKQQFHPKRTIYLALGHDEELGGPRGAEQIAKLLKSRNIEAEFVLDEGGAIVQGAIPGFDRQIATIGVAEKGSLSLDLTVRSEGGHSSTPPENTAIGILGTAIHRLEQHQMPKGLRGAAGAFMDFVAPELPFKYRVALANLWLFEGVVPLALGPSPAVNATMRTTTAVTMVSGGVKPNVLPTGAKATVNFRTLPGDTADVVSAHVRKTVNDERVELSINEEGRDATEISPIDVEPFRLLQRTIGQMFPGVIVAPFLTLGGTDSRHFSIITKNVYRFTPLIASNQDLARIHGTNERISVPNFIQVIQFYAQLIKQL